MARVGLLEKVTSEQRLAGNEETDGVNIWRKSDTSRKKAKAKLRGGRKPTMLEKLRGDMCDWSWGFGGQ